MQYEDLPLWHRFVGPSGFSSDLCEMTLSPCESEGLTLYNFSLPGMPSIWPSHILLPKVPAGHRVLDDGRQVLPESLQLQVVCNPQEQLKGRQQERPEWRRRIWQLLWQHEVQSV